MGRKILFITTDQQRYDSLGCNGGEIARTPVVDRLASEGINYHRAYNQNTVCMPARSTMLTGQYVRTHGVVANGVPLPEDAPASRRTAEKAGYRTALLGKAHFEPGFDPSANGRRTAAAAGDRTVARLRDAIQAMHVPTVRDPVAALRAWLREHHPRTCRRSRLCSRARAAAATPGRPRQEQPDPPRAGTTPTGSPIAPSRWLDSLDPTRRLVLLDELPRSAPPVGSARVGAAAACRWQRPRPARRAIPGSPDEDPRGPRAEAGALARVVRGRVRQHRGRARRRSARGTLTHDQIREINAKTHVMNELIDEACGRVLTRVEARGLARRHRRVLHHRPRRAAGRLRLHLQGSVPHRLVDAAAASCGDRRRRPA